MSPIGYLSHLSPISYISALQSLSTIFPYPPTHISISVDTLSTYHPISPSIPILYTALSAFDSSLLLYYSSIPMLYTSYLSISIYLSLPISYTAFGFSLIPLYLSLCFYSLYSLLQIPSLPYIIYYFLYGFHYHFLPLSPPFL